MEADNFYYLLDLERSFQFDRMYFWKPNKRGYTSSIKEAGIYSESVANAIVLADRDNRTLMFRETVINKLFE